MSEIKKGNELTDMEKQALTDNELEAVAGGFKYYCNRRHYWVHEGQGLIYCAETGVNYSLQRAPCDDCMWNARG